MDRLERAAALRPAGSVVGWARGTDSLVWHARIVALGAAALVLANVALSPDRLWFVWPLAAWAVVVVIHAAVVAWTWRSGSPGTDRSATARPNSPSFGNASGPQFAADSPTVERPRYRATSVPEPIAAVPRPDGALTAPVHLQMQDSVVAAGPSPEPIAVGVPRDDVLVASVAVHGLKPSAAEAGPATAIAPNDPTGNQRQDVPVSVIVLPESGTRAIPAAPERPVLPERVVALWAAPPLSGAQTWPAPLADRSGAGAGAP